MPMLRVLLGDARLLGGVPAHQFQRGHAIAVAVPPIVVPAGAEARDVPSERTEDHHFTIVVIRSGPKAVGIANDLDLARLRRPDIRESTGEQKWNVATRVVEVLRCIRDARERRPVGDCEQQRISRAVLYFLDSTHESTLSGGGRLNFPGSSEINPKHTCECKYAIIIN